MCVCARVFFFCLLGVPIGHANSEKVLMSLNIFSIAFYGSTRLIELGVGVVLYLSKDIEIKHLRKLYRRGNVIPVLPTS